MTVRLKDVAKAAGVSVTTASVVLRDLNHPMIGEDTKQRVLEAARSMSYQRNIFAASLRSGRTHQIGVMVRTLDNHPEMEKLEAVASMIWERGYKPMVRNCSSLKSNQTAFIHEFASTNVDGVVIVKGTEDMLAEELNPLTKSGIPIVVMEPIPGADFDCVTVSRKHGTQLAIDHLVGLGHRKIGLLVGTLSFVHARQRLEGYRQVHEDAGLEIDTSLIVEIPSVFDLENICRATANLIKRHPDMTGLFCNNDNVAIAAMKAAEDCGLIIPDDLSVVGFDDLLLSEFLHVPLTTVSEPSRDSAVMAVNRLFERIEDSGVPREPQMTVLEPHLIVRESTAPPRRFV